MVFQMCEMSAWCRKNMQSGEPGLGIGTPRFWEVHTNVQREGEDEASWLSVRRGDF